ncbi:acyl-CoA carboxylase subunit beta, partial [Virgibacillus halodenitrificans]|nr:acyl-CoA carboxylase subunit beta [Virgibacillus halodenitrificans]
MSYIEVLQNKIENIEKGGHEKYHQKNEEKGKLFVRKRLELLFDEGLNVEDAFFANCMDGSLPADGVV